MHEIEDADVELQPGGSRAESQARCPVLEVQQHGLEESLRGGRGARADAQPIHLVEIRRLEAPACSGKVWSPLYVIKISSVFFLFFLFFNSGMCGIT